MFEMEFAVCPNLVKGPNPVRNSVIALTAPTSGPCSHPITEPGLPCYENLKRKISSALKQDNL